MPSTQPFHRVNRESTAGLITRQLREAIMYGSLTPRMQLSEAVLAAQFGVSRGPLREAMQRLVQEGLVHAEPNRGLFVVELDEDDIRDLYIARAAVETEAGRQLIKNPDPEAISTLSQAAESLETAARTENLGKVSDADLEFHETLVNAAGSTRLRRMHETLMVETRMCLTAMEGTYRYPTEQAAEHRRIASAIADRDAEALVSAIDAHMQDALDRLIRPASTESRVTA